MSKSQNLIQELINLQNDLQIEIKKEGVANIAKIVNLKKSDIYRWLSGRQDWTWNKILKISDKLKI